MNQHNEARTEYLLVTLRMAERLVLPAAGMPQHYPYFDRLNGYHDRNGGTTAAARVTEAMNQGIITADEAMDLEMASLITSGRTDDHRADTVFGVEIQTSPLATEAALRRASILRRVLPSIPVRAMVITASTDEHTYDHAHNHHVPFIEFNPGGEFTVPTRQH